MEYKGKKGCKDDWITGEGLETICAWARHGLNDTQIIENIGKIPLTSAELVKAMFLSRENRDMDKHRQDEIALQWDNIEKDLHNESFWYFLTNNLATKYQTRIDLILDLISGKKNDSKDK